MRTRKLATLTTPLLALFATIPTAGCSSLIGQAPGELGLVQSRAAGCPAVPLLSQVDKDVSGSQGNPTIQAATFTAIRSQIESSVACAAKVGRGHITVRLFATNASQTATLLDTEIVVEGATEIARLRRVVRDQVADTLFAQVEAAYPEALAGLPAKGSDVLSRFVLAGEAERQLEQATGTEWALSLVVLTDGFASTPKGLSRIKTTAEAEALARETLTSTPSGLEGAWHVLLVGVGRTAAEKQPSTARIDAIKAFWRSYLAGTAEQVTVATDLPGSLAASSAMPSATATGEGR